MLGVHFSGNMSPMLVDHAGNEDVVQVCYLVDIQVVTQVQKGSEASIYDTSKEGGNIVGLYRLKSEYA